MNTVMNIFRTIENQINNKNKKTDFIYKAGNYKIANRFPEI